MASIRVIFFAELRELLSVDSMHIEVLNLSEQTVAGLHKYLVEEYSAFADYYQQRALLTAVNQMMVSVEHPVLAGDEVAIFPPVTGG